MSSTDNDTERFTAAEDGDAAADGDDADALFGCYSVLAPGVQIVLDGRAVSAPVAD